MLTRLLKGILNGIITFIVLSIIVVVIGMVPPIAFVGAILAPFVVWIAVLIGVLTFFGAVPDYWPKFNI